MDSARTFCQSFLSSDSKELTAEWVWRTSSSSVVFTWPPATARHRTFFIWDLTVALISALATDLSLWVNRKGTVQPYSGWAQDLWDLLDQSL